MNVNRKTPEDFDYVNTLCYVVRWPSIWSSAELKSLISFMKSHFKISIFFVCGSGITSFILCKGGGWSLHSLHYRGRKVLDKILVCGSVWHTIKRQDDGVTGVRHRTVFFLWTIKTSKEISHSKYKLQFKNSHSYLQFMVLLLRTLRFTLLNTVKSV